MGADRVSRHVLPFGSLKLLVFLGLPGCLLLDPPDGVNPDSASSGTAGGSTNGAAGRAGGSGGASSKAGAGGGGAGGGGGSSGKSARGGAAGLDDSGGTTGSGGAGGKEGSGTAGNAGSTAAGGRAGTGGDAGAGNDGGTAGEGAAGSAGTGSMGTCRNGIKEAGEGCDDDNDAPGDGCSPECTLESGWVCSGMPTSSCTPTHPSCAATPTIRCQGESCCESLHLGGGQFLQGKGTSSSFSNTLSSFDLDRFEVTVARFRAFLDDYDAWLAEGNPREGLGRHHNIPESGWNEDDAGWPYYESADNLTAAMAGCNEGTPYRTWAASGNDTLPVNCIDWYTAFLFCVWDGGRLPTEGEWEFAAVVGGYGYPYAWGDSALDDSPTTASLANYNCMGDGSEPGECAPADILPVGSKLEGWFGHYDLNGSVAEWTLDFNSAYPTLEKEDYAFVFGGFQREVRGGSFTQAAAFQTSVARDGQSADTPDENIGFRCARTPPQ